MIKFMDLIANIELKKGGFPLTGIITTVLGVFAYCMITFVPLPEEGTNLRDLSIDYHPDEGGWVVTGKHYFQKFFLEFDYSKDTWEDTRFGDFGPRNPVLGKYLYGAWLFAEGVVDRETDISGHVFKESQDWMSFWDERPPEKYLTSARRLAKWIGILCTILVFLLVRALTSSWLLGCLSAVFFIIQPLSFSQAHRAMMDVPMLFFSLITLFTASKLLVNISKLKLQVLYTRLMLVGLLCGLALQIKLNSLLTLVTVLVWYFFQIVWDKRLQILPFREFLTEIWVTLKKWEVIKKVTGGSMVLILSAMLVFIAINPFLYRDTPENIMEMFNYGHTVMDAWEIDQNSMNNTLAKKLKSLVSIGLHHSSISRYWLGLPSILDKGLVALGILFATLTLISRQGSTEFKRGMLMLCLWSLITAMGLLYWVPFKWARWYLPMAPVWAIFQSFGVLTLFNVAWLVFKSPFRRMMVRSA